MYLDLFPFQIDPGPHVVPGDVHGTVEELQSVRQILERLFAAVVMHHGPGDVVRGQGVSGVQIL